MDDPEVMEIKKGGGCLILLGLPFLALGLFVIFCSFSAVFTSNADAIGLLLGCLFGLIIGAIGGSLVFFRSGATLDRRTGTITEWWGLPFPLSRKESKLDQAREVSIKAETRRAKNHTYTVYVVRLEGVDLKLKFEEHREFDKSRALAERIAKFAHLNIHDYSGQGPAIREAGRLDESLQDRAARLGEVPAPPERMPDGCRIVHHVEGDEAVFELPRPSPGCAVLLLFATGITGLVALVLLNIPLGFVCIFLMVVASGMVKEAAVRERVRASGRGLIVERHLPLFVRSTEIPAAQLEELHDNGGTLVARSDQRTLRFGGGLKVPERAWLKGVLTTILSARPQS